jgi:glyoxylase-like metal-dependent hydrolase (beta-lactamase superfamily II)
VEELAPGLWHWKAAHPEWSPKDGGPNGWEQDVSSYAWDAGETLLLFDPQSPPQLVDELASGKRVAVALTCSWHSRSSGALRERLGATVWAPGAGVDPPDGVEPFGAAGDGEAALWVPGLGAVVFGDALLVRERLEVPLAWLPEGQSVADVRGRLAPLLELPVERVLVTHGDPVREDGAGALRTALGS